MDWNPNRCPQCNEVPTKIQEKLFAQAGLIPLASGGFEYAGGSEMCYDSQVPTVDGGKHTLFCSNDHSWEAEPVKETPPPPSYFPRWVICLHENLDYTFLGLAKTREEQYDLILEEMLGNNLRATSEEEGQATCLWVYIPGTGAKPQIENLDDMPRMEAFPAGYMDDLRKQASGRQVFLVKLEYRITGAPSEEAALGLAQRLDLIETAQSVVKAAEDREEVPEEIAALREALLNEHLDVIHRCELLRTDVRRPGEVGDW